MRVSVAQRLASAVNPGSSSGLRPAPLALLPPIPLYRRLLRGHRKYLPQDMRLLGDEYIKAEFRAHRNVENPVQLVSYTFAHELCRSHGTIFGIGILGSMQRLNPPPIDWLPHGVAVVCAENRGRLMGWREAGFVQAREDEW
jgi:hypothetical protein